MVLNWLFGKKKTEEPKKEAQNKEAQKQQTPQEKQQKESEVQWLYEYLIQYLTSPLWKIPIYEFIDENCIYFDDEEENKFEYTTIHKRFQDQVEAMVQQLMIDIGINEEQFQKMCEIGLRNKNHRKIFEQILIVDNFLIFKRLMVKRNKEMEIEAMKELDKHDGSQSQITSEPKNAQALKHKELEKEKSEIELAIEVSIAAQKQIDNELDEEDRQLQEALMQSKLSFMEENKKHDQDLSDSKIAQANALENQKVKQQEQQQQQQQQVKEQKFEETKKPVEEKSVPVPVAKEESKQQEEQKEEKPIHAPSTLPPLKANRTLPPLMTKPEYQRPVDDLLKQKQNLEDQLKVYKETEDKIKNAQVEEKQEDDGKSESLEDRKKRLLAQRELLRKKKQKQREEELKRFQELGVTEELQGEQKQEAIQKQQSLALDLEKSMPQSNISTEERKKRANLYSKIKSELEE